MPPFKPDRNQDAEDIRSTEKRSQKQQDDSDSDQILPPCDNLSIRQLRSGRFPYFADSGDFHAQKQSGENDIDQKSRQFDPAVEKFSGNDILEQGHEDQSDESADHRRGKIKFLQKSKPHPQELSQEQQNAKSAEGYDRIHFKASIFFGLGSEGKPGSAFSL
ncbi:hypothetical protein SDC9_195410 [bioreactor metagenome]|uniref:Uncharacterized protein n=1 Tax=bioreactor metagenome TaxID=1076179 RepID=A0A645IA80_9ZZZZ